MQRLNDSRPCYEHCKHHSCGPTHLPLRLFEPSAQPLFIYTDGLNEAENARQEQFGDEHLIEVLRDIHWCGARRLIENVAARVEEHRAGCEPNDDLTMMCLIVD
ncbi:MAG: serine/threonine-protein phosphatase [Prevotella sp.]|nr:serine/threonine-protein phosphatase [Prevotella sp.]